MSPLDPQNYTPIDIRALQKKTMFSTVQQPPSKTGKKGPSTVPFVNVMLVGSIVMLILSLSYSIQSTRLSSNSRASAPPPTTGYFAKNSVVTSFQNIPKSYGGEAIPTELMGNIQSKYGSLQTPQTKKYVTDKLMRYYAYRDVLKENGETLPEPTKDFNQVLEQIPQMEKILKEKILAKAEFAYVKAMFKTDAEKTRAKNLADTYKKRFTETNNFSDVITESNGDPALAQLNKAERNELVQDYYADDNTFSDPDFNTFLFSQNERVTSNVYALKTTQEKEFGYIVVYPIALTKHKYLYLDDIIKERLSKFR